MYVCTYIRTYVHTVHQYIHCLYIYYIHYTLSTLLLPITRSPIYIHTYLHRAYQYVCITMHHHLMHVCMYCYIHSHSTPSPTITDSPAIHHQTRHIPHTTNTLLLQYTDRHLYVNNVFVI